MIATLLRDIRAEVIRLLFNRCVFRTHQEIVRLNGGLQGKPRITFAKWGQMIYGVANSIAVTRLASSTFEPNDVNLVRFLEMFIQEAQRLWPVIESCYPEEAARAKDAVPATSDWEGLASQRVLDLDRNTIINAAEKVNHFASKRDVDGMPEAEVGSKFRNLDRAIDTVKKITEKYTLIVCRMEMRRLQVDKPSGWILNYDFMDQLKERDLLDEMKRDKLQKGWDEIFLEPWATKKTLALPLGEMRPPRSTGARDLKRTPARPHPQRSAFSRPNDAK
jgi:hypothetical protein